CDVSGAAGCNTANQANQGPGASDITPGSPGLVTHATNAAVGGTVSDTATITGLLGSTVPPGSHFGTITFQLFGPAAAPTCTAANLVFTSGAFDVFGNSPPDIGPATSGPLSTPGKYYWIASFTDDPVTDGGNNNATTACGDTGETSTVVDANIQITPANAT